MQYEVQDKWDDYTFGGSGIVGTVNVTRERLVKMFGEPMEVNGPRIKERWLLKFEDGTVATIFSDDKCKNNEWCVGGFGKVDKKTKENLSLRAVLHLLYK